MYIALTLSWCRETHDARNIQADLIMATNIRQIQAGKAFNVKEKIKNIKYCYLNWNFILLFNVITFFGPICPISCFPQGKSSSFAVETKTALTQKHCVWCGIMRQLSSHIWPVPACCSPFHTRAEQLVTHITHRCGARWWVTLDVDPFTPTSNIQGHCFDLKVFKESLKVFINSLLIALAVWDNFCCAGQS